MITQDCINKIIYNLDNDIAILGNKLAVSMKYGNCFSCINELYMKRIYHRILSCYNVFTTTPADIWIIEKTNTADLIFITSDNVIINLEGNIEEKYKSLFPYLSNTTFMFSYDEDNLYIWSYEIGAVLFDTDIIAPNAYNEENYIKAIEAMNCISHSDVRNFILSLNY